MSGPDDLLWLTVYNAACAYIDTSDDTLALEIATEACAKYPRHVRVDALLSDDLCDSLAELSGCSLERGSFQAVMRAVVAALSKEPTS